MRFAWAVLAAGLMLAAGPAIAGRPLSTDDASLEDAGVCHVESWWQRADTAHEWHFAPACGLAGNTELALELANYSPADTDRRALDFQIKTLLPALSLGDWSFAAKFNVEQAQGASDGRWAADGYSATGIASWALSPDVALHLNLGVQRSVRDAMWSRSYAAALAWNAGTRWLSFVELGGDDQSSAVRMIGARFWLIPDRLGLDFTIANQAGVPASRLTTLGLSLYGIGQ